jgi:hypothetical protein
MKIEISRLEELPRPMMTPAGWVEKRFRAIITELEIPSVQVTIDIEIRGVSEKFGNQIIAESVSVRQLDQNSNGVTGEMLRKIPVKMLIEASVDHAINFFYPQTKPTRRKSLRVSTGEQIGRLEQIAAIANELGVRSSARVISEKLSDIGVSLEEATIRNYLTKAKKAGMIYVFTNGDINQLPSFQAMSAEGDYIANELSDALLTGRIPVSPQQQGRAIAEESSRRAEKTKKNAKIREHHLSTKNQQTRK